MSGRAMRWDRAARRAQTAAIRRQLADDRQGERVRRMARAEARKQAAIVAKLRELEQSRTGRQCAPPQSPERPDAA